jgi:FkbM family methyltransferase
MISNILIISGFLIFLLVLLFFILIHKNKEMISVNIQNDYLTDKIVSNETKYGKMIYLKTDKAFVDYLIDGKIFEQDIIENHLMNIIRRSKVILDIGAHCGSHSIIYSKINPDCKIYSFEPQKIMFDILCMNINNNNIKNIKPYNYALGNKNCMATMSDSCIDGHTIGKIDLSSNNFYNLGGLQIGKGGENIEIKTLDDINFNEKIDFIKIDVEGFENFVIDGGMNTIIRYKPIIFFEHNFKVVTNEMYDYYNPVNFTITEKLQELGYKIILLNTDNYLAI